MHCGDSRPWATPVQAGFGSSTGGWAPWGGRVVMACKLFGADRAELKRRRKGGGPARPRLTTDSSGWPSGTGLPRGMSRDLAASGCSGRPKHCFVVSVDARLGFVPRCKWRSLSRYLLSNKVRVPVAASSASYFVHSREKEWGGRWEARKLVGCDSVEGGVFFRNRVRVLRPSACGTDPGTKYRAQPSPAQGLNSLRRRASGLCSGSWASRQHPCHAIA